MSNVNYWHARYHEKSLHGYMGLSLEERAAYTTVLDLLYARGEPIVDNERLIAAWLECSTRKWRSLRNSLIEKGKIQYNEKGHITNKKFQEELEKDVKMSRKRSENAAKAGRASGEARKKANENNKNGERKRTTITTTITRESKLSLVEKENSFLKFWESFPRTDGQNQLASRTEWLKLDDGQRDRCLQGICDYAEQANGAGWYPYIYLRDRIFEQVAVAPVDELAILIQKLNKEENDVA